MNIKKLLIALLAIICSSAVKAQDKIVYPDISYAGSPRTLTIGAINVTGAEGVGLRWGFRTPVRE